MCGIVGASCTNNVLAFLLDGLKRLEYRGYDSVGIAVHQDNEIETYKQKGRVSSLSDKVGKVESTCGIGHTRWATHGEPSDINSHPHTSSKFTVVHNGIIENYRELKGELIEKGYEFVSETDTEAIAHLLSDNYDGNLASTVVKTVKRLVGSFALGIICEDFPNLIAVCKKDSPLIVGKGKKGNYIASDGPALAGYVDSVYVMQDNDMALIFPDRVEFFDQNLKNLDKSFEKADLEPSQLELCGAESFMMKEIGEIPSAIINTADSLKNGGLDEVATNLVKNTSQITVIGCGTAYHAGLVGKAVIEEKCRVPVNVEIASEYRYRNPIVKNGEIVVAVSQSGETADTIAAVKLAKQKGATVITITNVKNSSITTFSDYVLYTQAGPEIAVAATKSYNSQLVVFYYLAHLIIGEQESFFEKCKDIARLSKELIDSSEKVLNVSRNLSSSKDAFFLGRGKDYCTALEGSLKLKEITYIHSEGISSGELKHGTLALIEKGMPVFAIVTQSDLVDKTMNALHEVKARGAKVILITKFERLLKEQGIDHGILIPSIEDEFAPILSIISLQLLSYYVSRAKGIDPDKPRNLAKSVTVE